MKICPTCSVEYPDSERFCPKDGTALHARAGATDLVGSVIAERYHVLKRLGAGGMGRVYLAEHVKMGRQCAIKVLHPAIAGDSEAIARFNREAANASRIDHPNVAAIYDFGEAQDGLLYLAMQFVEGKTLSEIISANGVLAPLRVNDMIRQAAEGLYAAHSLGIVHRDLKPDNVMIMTDADGFDHVKLVDFGIAKSTGEQSQGVTRAGVVVGTLEYMSPEQLAGDDIDGRSDLYSLALVAFNMLTGTLPFSVASTSTTIVTRLTEAPRSLADVRPEIAWPNELQAVMTRALAREPDARHSSIRDFAREFHAAIALMPAHSPTTGLPLPAADDFSPSATTIATPAARPTPINSMNRRLRQRTMLTAGAVGVLLLLVIALLSRGAIRKLRSGAALRDGIAAMRQGRRDIAREQFVEATKDAPRDPMPHVYLSRLAREMNDLGTAREEAVQAVRLGANNSAALRELATTLFATQNFEAARAFYARAISADTADHISQGYLGCTLIQLGRVQEGLRWIRRAGSGTWSTCATEASSIGGTASRE